MDWTTAKGLLRNSFGPRRVDCGPFCALSEHVFLCVLCVCTIRVINYFRVQFFFRFETFFFFFSSSFIARLSRPPSQHAPQATHDRPHQAWCYVPSRQSFFNDFFFLRTSSEEAMKKREKKNSRDPSLLRR
jgi:hypothetical protein